jgi:hypothetical protein
MIWDIIYRGEEINDPSTTVSKTIIWVCQVCSNYYKAEEDVQLLNEPRHDDNAIEIDISYLHHY